MNYNKFLQANFKKNKVLYPQILKVYDDSDEDAKDLIVALCKEIVLLEGLNEDLEADITHLLS